VVLAPHVRPLSAAALPVAPLHLCFGASLSVSSLFFSHAGPPSLLWTVVGTPSGPFVTARATCRGRDLISC